MGGHSACLPCAVGVGGVLVSLRPCTGWLGQGAGRPIRATRVSGRRNKRARIHFHIYCEGGVLVGGGQWEKREREGKNFDPKNRDM